MRYLEIMDDLVLVEQTIPALSKAEIVATTNHILIFDRSYSMSQQLRQLGKDLISKLKELPVGDTVTLGWFSGEDEYNIILKGFKITEDRDYKILEDTVNGNLQPVGCTCFSEILLYTDQVVADLSALSENFTLSFFTDGHPVVRDRTREIKDIKRALTTLESKISSGLFIGYGNYYNKQLMAEMASTLGGSLTHCSTLDEYKDQLSTFLSGASEAGKKVRVKLATDTTKTDVAFSLVGGVVNSYEVTDENTVNAVAKSTASQLFVLTKAPPQGAVKVDLAELTTKKNDPLLKGAYASALLLTQKAKSDQALEVLGVLGDVALINQVNNAYTIEEFGKVEGKIKRAVTHQAARFKDGRNTNYLPAKDAFCLLDALDVLLADDENYFLPYHKEFDYRKIGVASKPAEAYPKFQPDLASKCKISSLTWHQKKLNLSVLAAINGIVELGEHAEAYGFAKNYPTHVFRNYALVKDGFLNIKRLPVVLSEKTREFFSSLDLIEKAGDTDILVLENIPVINRVIAEGSTSAKDLCRNVYKEIVLQAHMKALKFVKAEIEGAADLTTHQIYSKAQEEYLAKYGIGKKGEYAPKMLKQPVQDYYYAKEFEVKVKGHSSLPKIVDVREKLANGKSLTVTGELVNQGLALTSGLAGSAKVKLAILDDLIKAKNLDLFKVRKETQRTKFAILLASKWFDEFDSLENCVLDLDGKNFTLSVREVTVDI